MRFRIGNARQKFAETPDAALVERFARGAAVEPERLQSRRFGGGTGASPVQVGSPSGKKEFQKIAASGATEILAGGIGCGAAGNATELRIGFRVLSNRHFALSPDQRTEVNTSYGLTVESAEWFVALALRISQRFLLSAVTLFLFATTFAILRNNRTPAEPRAIYNM